MQSTEKHFAVSGFVMNPEETKLLMVFHRKLNVWVIPGGHLEPNEYPHEGALREIKEETGIEAKILDSSEIKCKFSAKEAQIPTPYLILSEFIPTKGDKEAHIHIDLIYLAVADEKEVVKQEDEVEDVKWMTWEEVLESNTFESIKEFARKRVGENERTQNSINSIL